MQSIVYFFSRPINSKRVSANSLSNKYKLWAIYIQSAFPLAINTKKRRDIIYIYKEQPIFSCLDDEKNTTSKKNAFPSD